MVKINHCMHLHSSTMYTSMHVISIRSYIIIGLFLTVFLHCITVAISYKYKENLVILQLIGIIVIKNKETRVIIYTSRYSSGNLIPS